jgi:hypothetical protein
MLGKSAGHGDPRDRGHLTGVRRATRTAAVVLLTATASVALPVAGAAKGPPTTETVITEHFTKSIVLADSPPCIGTVTYDVRDVFHITYSSDVIQHITDSQTGDVTFASDVDGQLYTGRFQGTFNLQSNQAGAAYSETGTYHLHVTAADGSRLRLSITFHGTFAAGAETPTVELDKPRCSAR